MKRAGNGHKWLAAGTASLIAEPALQMAHQGTIGVIVGLAVGAAAYALIDDVEMVMGKSLALPARTRSDIPSSSSHRGRPSLAHRLLVGKSVRDDEEEAATGDETIIVSEEEDSEPVIEPAEEDDAFTQAETQQSDSPGVARITVDQMVAHTERNSYEVYIGRSLTRPGNPAVKINFRRRHIKLIGATQHGKSSEAGAILEAILCTHDPKYVKVALLDLENKTSRLFADAPHVLKLRIDGEAVRFHARSYSEVLEHMGYLSSLVDSRYVMSEEELEQQPLILAYLEEFVDLKNYFKQRMSAAVAPEEREAAKQDYARLIFYIKKLAARGLKVHVQFLMCAQVDYRDDDLQEALVNVTSGMSFCVRVSAALAAGFYQSELLARNAREDQIGQCVVEMPDCKDLVLAPEYDLKARLRALPRETYEERETPASLPIATRMGPLAPAYRPAAPIDAELERALVAYDAGHTTQNALAIALDMSPWSVRPLYTKVKMLRGTRTG